VPSLDALVEQPGQQAGDGAAADGDAVDTVDRS
jgi:hypothetical protein